MFFKLPKKELKYGKYKINKVDDYAEFIKMIRKNAIIKSNDKGEIYLELKNVPILIVWQLDKYTNVRNFVDYEGNFSNVFDKDDKDLQKLLKRLKNNILCVLKDCKKEMKRYYKELENNLKILRR